MEDVRFTFNERKLVCTNIVGFGHFSNSLSMISDGRCLDLFTVLVNVIRNCQVKLNVEGQWDQTFSTGLAVWNSPDPSVRR